MNKVVRLFIIFAVLVAGGAFPTTPAHACRCDSLTRDEAFEAADVIFVGYVLDTSHTISHYQQGLSFREKFEEVFATFSVSRVWKGPVEARLTVRSQFECGQIFIPWREYLVYATEEDGAFRIQECGRGTVGISDATEALPTLGEGQAPILEGSTVPPQWIGVVVLLFLGVLVRPFRRWVNTSRLKISRL